MKSKKLLILLAVTGMACSANAASILLGGFDGNQTQNTIAPAGITSSTGVRELTGAKQDALAVGTVTTRIWTTSPSPEPSSPSPAPRCLAVSDCSPCCAAAGVDPARVCPP